MAGRRGWMAAGVVAVLVLAAAVVVWGGTRAVGPAPAGQNVTFAAVGDSLTEADSPNFAAGRIGEQSWILHAEAAGLDFAGGWARWGAPTSLMAANVRPVDADVLVVLAGTNDVARGVPFAETAANIASIVAAAGPERVVVSAVLPVGRHRWTRGARRLRGLQRAARGLRARPRLGMDRRRGRPARRRTVPSRHVLRRRPPDRGRGEGVGRGVGRGDPAAPVKRPR